MSVKAERNGTIGWFPEGVWSSGVPERNGWVRLGKTQVENIIPKEVIDFSEKQATEVKKKDVRDAVRKIGTEPVETPDEPEEIIYSEGETADAPKPVAKRKRKPKTKKNG